MQGRKEEVNQYPSLVQFIHKISEDELQELLRSYFERNEVDPESFWSYRAYGINTIFHQRVMHERFKAQNR